jgi:hypothetical protein
MNGPSKIDCYITLGRNAYHGQTLLLIWPICKVQIIKFFENIYWKQGTKMTQLVFRSADIYCQITNNHFYAAMIVLYSNGKKGERASCRRDRERSCARDRECLKTELASVVKTAVGRKIIYFEISRDARVRITFS